MQICEFNDLQPGHPFVVVDGGLATELERRGADLRHDLWSAKMILDSPSSIRDVHLDFFRAGCDIATTASYQASRKALLQLGKSESQSRAVLHDSVSLAREAAEKYRAESRSARRLWVAGSCGSIGASYADGSEFTGAFEDSFTEMRDYHRWKIECLIESKADLIAFETIPCCREAEAILSAIEAWPSLRCWISFVARNANCLGDGTDIAEAFGVVDQHPQVLAFGINCTKPAYVSSLVGKAPVREKPLVIYPNSGEDWNAADRSWESSPDRSETWRDLQLWQDSGAKLIGGCCRVTVEDIKALADRREQIS